MLVRHIPSKVDPALCSSTQRAWVYRTEVENNLDRPIRIVWFEFHFQDGEDWFGVNVRRRPLRNADFREWYGDDSGGDPGEWLAPGAVAVCDPNYSWAFSDEISPVKWSFLAVDSEGNDYFAEALVPQEAAALYDPSPHDSA